jgi:hypothetical protein
MVVHNTAAVGLSLGSLIQQALPVPSQHLKVEEQNLICIDLDCFALGSLYVTQ